MSTSVGPLPAGRSRPAMVAEVAANLGHLPDHATVVVACSGGPDSSALAHLASEARPDLTLVLVHVAHGLRDRSAELTDREVVTTHASWLGAEAVACDVEVAVDGRGIEAAARDVRYAALRSAAAERGAVAILVGHSADDQAETVLLRLARGTGTDGLAAMAVVAGDLLRPLLRLRRADLHAFVVGEGLPVATDATNRDDAIRRVRVRQEVLPALERIGPDPVAGLGRLAGLARDDAAALAVAAAAVPAVVRIVGPVVALRSEALRSVPVAIARRVVRRALSVLIDRPPSAATVARILDAPVGDAATLPGGVAFRAERAWRTLVIVDGGDGQGVGAPPTTGSFVQLPTPGRLVWNRAGLMLRSLVPTDDVPEFEPGEQIALSLPGAWSPPRHRVETARTAPGTISSRYAVTLPAGVGEMEVRVAIAGDRIRGPGGSRRVVDVFRDAGMPRAIRSRWPLLSLPGPAGGRVVWMAGVAVDAELLAAGRREPALVVQAMPTTTKPPPTAGSSGRHA